jgi:aspartyl-tRNA(Asn)/glutamyl-tRNA(Gln) amidotransferase subunit A
MELWQLDASALNALYSSKAASPMDVLGACIKRFKQTHRAINAICHLDEEGALQAARASESRMQRGTRLGALDGVPITIKDNLYVRGMPATWGSKLYASHVPTEDDIVVARMRAMGACILGKTNTPEFALSGRTDNLLFGATRNPVDLRLTPGGSSGGAVAATAAGITPIAIATDAGGSTRLPASYTGLFGLRPSNGRIPRCHGFPPLASDFQVIGLITRTIDDLAQALEAVAGPDSRDRSSLAIALLSDNDDHRPYRIRLVDKVGEEPVDPAVLHALQKVAEQLRAAGMELHDGVAPYNIARVRAVWNVLSTIGVARVLESEPVWREAVTPDIARIAEAASSTSALSYVAALDEVAAMRLSIDSAFGEDDFILTPTAAVLPWPIERLHAEYVADKPGTLRSASIFSTWVNACGLPAVNLPLALSATGLPIGVQLIGRFASDDRLLSAARQLLRVVHQPTWHPLDPPVSDTAMGPLIRYSAAR